MAEDIKAIRQKLQAATMDELPVLFLQYESDKRVGVRKEIDRARRRVMDYEKELARTEELKKYDVSCGYKPGAFLFGGVNEGKLRCLRNRTEAKVVRTFSKSVGLPKIEADLCRYQRQHIAGSLLYANFKVQNQLFIVF